MYGFRARRFSRRPGMTGYFMSSVQNPAGEGSLIAGERAFPGWSHLVERLLEVGEDVVLVLDAEREADIAVGDAGLQLFLGRQL